jgi:hypothetical protein
VMRPDAINRYTTKELFDLETEHSSFPCLSLDGEQYVSCFFVGREVYIFLA